jgi:penicillin-binding protein 1A
MRAERRRRRTWRSRFRIFWVYVEIAILILMAVMLGVIGGTFYSVSKILPTGMDVASYDPTEATKIISSDGVILAEIYEENREVVPITEIPKSLRDATVAIEDERFYSHVGIDLRGIARALFHNLRTGHMGQGGSTITQQLARNIYLTREKKLSRKLQEIVLALELERNYSKEQILELYLNQVYYGSGAYGVQTASRIYFDRDVKDLTLSECAMLAGLPQKPSYYSPYEDMDAALKRQDTVLDHMLELGYITSEECEQAKSDTIMLVGLKPAGLGRYKAPWFVTYVIKQLIDEYGADLVYRGGLRVYTALNYEMQQIAEEELRRGVAAAKSRNVTQGALICIDPLTGYIRAMVGSVNPDFTKDQFNRAVQARRQPGSSFKAFVYAAAVDAGYDPSYRVSNKPITYKGKPWPDNYNRRQAASTYSMRQAIADSVNRCAVNMTQTVGIDQVITYARMLGITSDLDRNCSLALGASVVTPLEICSAYGVFAAEGVRAEPMAIVRITESDGFEEGGIIEDNRPVTNQVLSTQTAETMSEMFRATVVSGTGYAARPVPNSHGKTGTTSDDRDAWFIGYTPELVTAVWVGNDNYTPMKGVWGGNVCAPVWTAFMRKAVAIHKREMQEQTEKGDKKTPKTEPESRETPRPKPHEHERTSGQAQRTVKICADSGLKATANCPNTYEATYDPGTEPSETCTIHPSTLAGRGPTGETTPSPAGSSTRPAADGPSAGPRRPGTSNQNGQYITVTICVDSGQLATRYCPETIPRTYRIEEAPKKACKLHGPLR